MRFHLSRKVVPATKEDGKKPRDMSDCKTAIGSFGLAIHLSA